jgi:hypothetical protein
MSRLRIFGRFFIVMGVWAVASCGEGREMAELSYQFNLSPSQAVEFKSDLRDFAANNDYAFVDGSSETKEAREYINQESERSSGKNPGLVSQDSEIIDVTVEPRDSGSEFLIFAKTSAYDAEKVSLTVVYDKDSAAERRMADNFSQSQFFRKWS